MKNIKSLVIHPEDSTTTFLEPIYEKAQEKTVIRKNATADDVANLIKTSDRVMIMGHGSPMGLFNVGKAIQDAFKWYAIGEKESKLLQDKPENIYIWCNADKFVEFHGLRGFYSGMFISEVSEAKFCGVDATQEQVTESNDTFSEIVGKYIHLPVEELYAIVIAEYGKLAETNPVAKYNHERLYLR